MAIMSQGSRWFFNGHTVTATTSYIYDETNSSATDAGAIMTKTDNSVVQIGVPSLTASCLYYRLEGRFDTIDRWASIFTGTILATTSIDILKDVSYKVKEIRLGVYLGSDATPNIIYAGVCNSETR